MIVRLAIIVLGVAGLPRVTFRSRLDVNHGPSFQRVADADPAFSDLVCSVLVDALSEFDEIPKPVVVRLAGTNAEEGMEILNTDLIEVEETLEAAVQRAVKNAEEVTQ